MGVDTSSVDIVQASNGQLLEVPIFAQSLRTNTG